MAIKKQYFFIMSVFLLLTGLLMVFPLYKDTINPGISSESIMFEPEVKTSDTTLIDKVYNFTTDYPLRMLKEIPFRATYKYYVYFQVVTPHECEITVTIFDPLGSQYDVYHKDKFTQAEGLKNFPFGVALTGPHNIRFELGIAYNMNMHIKIVETEQCLYDVFNWQEIQNIRQYGVAKFEDSPPLIRNLPLESDVAYTLYFSRVTPFSDLLPNYTVRYDYSLLDDVSILDDEQDIVFIINWRDTPLAPINDVTTYSFGTAHGGPYQTNLTVEYDYNPVNIAYAIVYDYKISGEIDGNGTSADTGQESAQLFSIPVELGMGTMIGIGTILIVVIGIAITKRREFHSY